MKTIFSNWRALHFPVAMGILVGFGLTACGGGDDNSSPSVSTDKGFVVGVQTDALLSYRGIPYAAPPVGALRWTAPQSASAWTQPRAARKRPVRSVSQAVPKTAFM